MDEGLCNEESLLYNREHCDMCRYRTAEVYLGLAWFVIIVEHLLLLLKIFVMAAVPDKPAFVRKDEARTAFLKDRISREMAGASVAPE
eukprot:2601204-Prymnesium_polylepis.1